MRLFTILDKFNQLKSNVKMSFNEIKDLLGRVTYPDRETLKNALCNAVKLVWISIPILFVLILFSYLFFQIFLFICNNIIPLFIDWNLIKFSNKLFIAFHTGFTFWLRLGRFLFFILIAKIIEQILLIYADDFDQPFNFLLLLAIPLFLAVIIIPKWFTFVCISLNVVLGFCLLKGIIENWDSGEFNLDDYDIILLKKHK